MQLQRAAHFSKGHAARVGTLAEWGTVPPTAPAKKKSPGHVSGSKPQIGTYALTSHLTVWGRGDKRPECVWVAGMGRSFGYTVSLVCDSKPPRPVPQTLLMT